MARKPPGGGFVTMTKSFEDDMADCTLAEIGLMSLMITSASTTPLGSIYRRYEWGSLPGSSEEMVDKALEGLEAKGKIVRSGHDILIKSWVRRRTFITPNYLKACLYPLQVQVKDPLMRVVLATELLRKDIASIEPAAQVRGSKDAAGRTYAKGQQAHYQALELIWEELTGKGLPPAKEITGSVEEPNQEMVGHILDMREFPEAVKELDKRRWVCVQPSLAEHIREAFYGANVKPIRGAREAT